MAQRKTLLIVDDDADLRGAVAEQLQAEEFDTLEAATAAEGVRLAEAASSAPAPASEMLMQTTLPSAMPATEASAVRRPELRA